MTESTASTKNPPPLPPGSAYTSCYCEENIYLLCKSFSRPEILDFWSIHVVFVSNENKKVALGSQKAGRLHGFVVWDYHVFLVLTSKKEAVDFNPPDHENTVYDFDTTLSIPCPWEEYFSSTFLEDLPPQYQCMFRVIPGEMFLKYFASDRSHMNSSMDGGNHHSPPPPYPPIQGQSAIDSGMDNILMSHYVDMHYGDDSGSYGKVYGYEGVIDFFLD